MKSASRSLLHWVLPSLLLFTIGAATGFYFGKRAEVTAPPASVAVQKSPSPAHTERTISSETLTCQALLREATEYRKVFSPNGLQKFKGPKGRVMIYDYKMPSVPGKKTMLLIHGLGDDMGALRRIAERAEADGYGVLLVDLHGHGKTLEEYLADHNGKLPDEIDYRENVDDIKKLVRQLGLKNLVIVGHSYGGGIALKVSEELPKKLVFSVHALAPYVQRIDKYIVDRMNNPAFMLASVYSIMDPLASFTWKMTRPFKIMQDLSNAMLGLDKLKDVMMDPAMKGVLTKTYRSYFLKAMDKKEEDLTSQEDFFLSARVEAAILVTKGVRGLDYLVSTVKLGVFPKIVQIIGGARDELVLPDQLKAFSHVLTDAGIPHELVQMEGAQSTHLFPQLMPDNVYDAINHRVQQGESDGQ